MLEYYNTSYVVCSNKQHFPYTHTYTHDTKLFVYRYIDFEVYDDDVGWL